MNIRVSIIAMVMSLKYYFAVTKHGLYGEKNIYEYSIIISVFIVLKLKFDFYLVLCMCFYARVIYFSI